MNESHRYRAPPDEDYCAYCGNSQNQLTWACPSCTTKYCSFNCMNNDRISHSVACIRLHPLRHTLQSKTYYSSTNVLAPSNPIKKEHTGSYKTKSCKFFMAGDCTQGDQCTFLHTDNQPVCVHFMAGHCEYGERCYNLHPVSQENNNETPVKKNKEKIVQENLTKKKSTPCKFYQVGKCSRGDKCLFLHNGDQESTPQVYSKKMKPKTESNKDPESDGICDHYLRGKCIFGDECWKEHRGIPVTNKEKKTLKNKKIEVKVEVNTAPKVEVNTTPFCDHFQRGVCNYGEDCWKRHEKQPLYKAPYGPKLEDTTTEETIKDDLNNINNEEDCSPCYDDDDEIFMSDTESEGEVEIIITKNNNISPTNCQKSAPQNIFEILGTSQEGEESHDDEDHHEELEILNNDIKNEEAKEDVKRENLSNAEKKRLKKEKRKEREKAENLMKIDRFKETGDRFFKEYRYIAAIKSYTEAISLCGANNPSPELFNKRAAAHMMSQNFTSAQKDLKKVVMFESNNWEAQLRIVKCCLELGKIEEGRTNLELIKTADETQYKILESELDTAAKFDIEARHSGREGRYQEASTHMEKVIEICSHSSGHRSLLGLYLALLGQRTEAAGVMAVGNQGGHREDRAKLFAQAIIHYYEDDMDRAITEFKEARKEFPEAEKWQKKAQVMQNAFVNGNKAMKIQHNYTQAKQAYDSGLAQDPSNTVYMAKMYLARALLQEIQEKFEEAIDDCSSCIKVQPKNFKAWDKRGDLRLITEDYSAAAEDFKIALTIERIPETLRKLEDARIKEKQAKRRKPTYYEVLGVEETATVDKIKKAYRAKAKEFHPDKHAREDSEGQTRMENKMKEISIAHSCLSDKDKRSEYDDKLRRMKENNKPDTEDSCSDCDEEEFDVKNFFYFIFGINQPGSSTPKFRSRVFIRK